MRSNTSMSKPFIEKAIIEITKESGEVIKQLDFNFETAAQEKFNQLAEVRSPYTYESFTMNLSEYPEGRIGSVRLVAISRHGDRYVRRELFRKP